MNNIESKEINPSDLSDMNFFIKEVCTDEFSLNRKNQDLHRVKFISIPDRNRVNIHFLDKISNHYSVKCRIDGIHNNSLILVNDIIIPINSILFFEF